MIICKSPTFRSAAVWLLAGAFLLISFHTASAAPEAADQTNAPLPNVIYPLSASSPASDTPRPPAVVAPAAAPQPVQVIYGYSYPAGEYFSVGGVLARRTRGETSARGMVAPGTSLSNARPAGIVLSRAAHFGGTHYR